MRASMRLGLALLSLAIHGACAPELPPVRLESEHVRLRSHESWFCDGTIAWLEHHYVALSSFLGVDLPGGRKIDVVVIADPAELADTCRSGGVAVDGCADGTAAFAIAPFHPHELVHAYASLLGDPPFFFQEGLAEVIGCGEKGSAPPVERPSDVRTILTTEGFRGLPPGELARAYGVAAELTRHLVDVHGREAFLAFYGSIGREAGLDAIDAAMQAHLGASLDTVLDGYAASPPRAPGELCLRVAECAAPPIDGDGAALACGVGVHPLTLFFPNVDALSRSIPAVSEEGLRFHGAGFPALGGSIASCDGGLDPTLAFVALDPGAPFEVWTNPPAGDYAVTAWKSPASGDPPSGTLALERVAAPAASGCEGAGVRVVPAGTEEITALGELDWPTATPLAAGRARAVFAFELEEDALAEPLVTIDDPPLEGETAWLCAGGCPEDDGAVCEAIDLAPAVPYVPFLIALDAGEPLHLVVDGTPGETGFRFGLRLSGSAGDV